MVRILAGTCVFQPCWISTGYPCLMNWIVDQQHEVLNWLVVWNHGILWLSIYWEEWSQLTFIFFRGVETTNPTVMRFYNQWELWCVPHEGPWTYQLLHTVLMRFVYPKCISNPLIAAVGQELESWPSQIHNIHFAEWDATKSTIWYGKWRDMVDRHTYAPWQYESMGSIWDLSNKIADLWNLEPSDQLIIKQRALSKMV